MIVSFIYVCLIIGVVLTFINPIYGVGLVMTMLQLRPETYVTTFSTYHINLIVALFTLLCSLRKLDINNNLKPILLSASFVLLIIMSSVFEDMGVYGVKEALYVFFKCFMLFFLILNCINTKKDLMTIVVFCIFICTANATMAIYQKVFVKVDRAFGFGDYVDMNAFAMSILCFAPLAYYLFIHGKNKFIKNIFAIAVLLIIVGVLASVSRAALLALAYLMIVILGKNIKKISTYVMIGIIALVFIGLAGDWLKKRETITTSISGKTKLDTSATKRLDFWSNTPAVFIRHPLLGTGTCLFAEACRKELGIIHQHHGVHNTWLEVLVEHGAIGFIVFIMLISIALKTLNQLLVHGIPFIREFGEYLKLGFMVIIICSIFVSYQRDYSLWVFLALIFSLLKISNKISA